MSDPSPLKCPNCGAELDSDSSESLCPRCLIENAAWSQTVATPEEAAAVPPMRPPVAGLPASHRVLPDGSVFGGFSISGSIIETRHHLLSFKLPRLETHLLGVDPERILAESELHLFQAAPVVRGKVDLTATSTHGSGPASPHTIQTAEDDESGL